MQGKKRQGMLMGVHFRARLNLAQTGRAATGVAREEQSPLF
jgi:hypothetical protein